MGRCLWRGVVRGFKKELLFSLQSSYWLWEAQSLPVFCDGEFVALVLVPPSCVVPSCCCPRGGSCCSSRHCSVEQLRKMKDERAVSLAIAPCACS